MKIFKKEMQKADLFGKLLTFEEEENQKFTTVFGVLMTFIILITCCVACFRFGQEIYQRKSPTVLNSNEKIDYSAISLSDFPILFTFFNGSGQIISEAPKYISVELVQLIIPESGLPTKKSFKGYKNCVVSDFLEVYQPYLNAMYAGVSSDIFCINYDDTLYFQNEYTNSNSAFINLKFSLIESSDEEYLKKQAEIMSDIFVYLVYIESFVDSSNYDNPINYYIYSQTQGLSKGLLQSRYMNIERLKLITHQGWLLEDIIEEEIFSTRSITKEVFNNNYGDLYWVFFSSPNIRTKIIRTYMKVQELFAKIGGFFNALFILITAISKNYVDFSFYMHIYKHFYKLRNPTSDIIRKNRPTNQKKSIDKVVRSLVIKEYKSKTNMEINNSLIKNNITAKNSPAENNSKNNLAENIKTPPYISQDNRSSNSNSENNFRLKMNKNIAYLNNISNSNNQLIHNNISRSKNINNTNYLNNMNGINMNHEKNIEKNINSDSPNKQPQLNNFINNNSNSSNHNDKKAEMDISEDVKNKQFCNNLNLNSHKNVLNKSKSNLKLSKLD